MSSLIVQPHPADAPGLSTRAIQHAIDAVHAGGGGRVVLPAGDWLTGTITLRSHVELHLAAGARLLASENPADYPNTAHCCLIEAFDARGVALSGTGAIDGRGTRFMEREEPYIFRYGPFRPRLIGLVRCQQVSIRDITLHHAAMWGLHLSGCEYVHIHAITILNHLKIPNCDGIDPDHCRHVRISDCHIEAGDDCIVLKNTRPFADCGPTEDITITNCTLCSTSAAIKIGTESVDDFRRIAISNCTIRDSSRGIALQLRDHGSIEQVRISDCIIQTRLFFDNWWGRAEPIYITAIHRDEASPLGRIRDVHIRGIQAQSENGIFLAGSADSILENILLSEIDLTVDKRSKWPGGQHDRRPSRGGEFVGLSDHPTSLLYGQYVWGLRVSNARLRFGPAMREQAYCGQPIELEHAEGTRLDQVELD